MSGDRGFNGNDGGGDEVLSSSAALGTVLENSLMYLAGRRAAGVDSLESVRRDCASRRLDTVPLMSWLMSDLILFKLRGERSRKDGAKPDTE